MSLQGFEIRWNKENPIIEIYQNDRNNFNWFIKRIFRYASSSVLIDKFLFGNLFGAVRSLMKIFYYSINFVNFNFYTFKPKVKFFKIFKLPNKIIINYFRIFWYFSKKIYLDVKKKITLNFNNNTYYKKKNFLIKLILR